MYRQSNLEKFWNFTKLLNTLLPKFKKGYFKHNISFLLIFFSALLGTLTLAILSGVSVFSTNPKFVLYILATDTIVFLGLAIFTAKKILEIWAERKQGLAGSKLHVRFSLIFAALSVAPAVMMTLLSVFFFHFGIQDWFSNRVKSALAESVSVAQSYLEEHKRTVSKDAGLMAYDLDKQLNKLKYDRNKMDAYLTHMTSLRSLSEAMIFDDAQNILGRSNLTFALQFEPIPLDAINQAKNEKIVFLSNLHKDRIRALVRLPTTPDIYLFVGRSVDPTVLNHLRKAEAIFAEYGILEGKRLGFEIVVIALFLVISLLLLMLSIWIGLIMARKLVRPIRDLIEASEQIRKGNLNVRVVERDSKDELNILSRSFNRMTLKLKKQQKDLLDANKTLDERRRFIESILSGVSSGVIRLDLQGKIVYPNDIASNLLERPLDNCRGKRLSTLVPELHPILKQAFSLESSLSENQVEINLNGSLRIFMVHIVPEKTDDIVQGYVITLDDITKLIAAQKQAAWSDAARRVAHEIKNPLTPIHLSAERLKRKYLQEIKTDPRSFLECIDTITRQVNFIGHLVSEFSAFARMPTPLMSKNNINDILSSTIELQKTSHPSIKFSLKTASKELWMQCDEQQIHQALMNIIKNAAEALLENTTTRAQAPSIAIKMENKKDTIEIFITDNGPGFPSNGKDTLLDPYITTRSKGTGLGLAIVKKIIEDHMGKIYLYNRKKTSGAIVRLVFPKSNDL